MLTNEEVEQRLKSTAQVLHVQVDGDGYQYKVTVVSDLFIGKPKRARQQWVYAQLGDYISTGKLHAISMQTYTQEEWGRQNG